MNILVRGGRLFDPANGIDDQVDIFIHKKRIAGLGSPPPDFKAKLEIDATGKYVFPGLVDLCARLREPGEEHKATILSETRAASAGGITQMVCPPDTFPIIDTPAMARMVQDRADDAGHARVHPLGALTVGLAGNQLTDMATLVDAGCVGVSNGLITVENSLVMRRAMQYASTYDIKVFLTPRDPWLYGNGVVHEGAVSTWLGLPAVPEAAETVGVARDLALVETSGASAHIDLISCARSISMIREARERGMPVSSSVSIHHLAFSEENIGAFDTMYKVMPPLRTVEDRDALVAGVDSGVIDAICSDHQPHGADAKTVPFGEAATGIAGLDTLLTQTWALVREGRLSPVAAISALTINPARIIGIDAGHLSEGALADLCIFDPEHAWRLDARSMTSKGRNSPLLGKDLVGRVTHTLFHGKPVFTLKP